MKYISNNEADGVLERLLKAEIGRASRGGASCTQFDPDFSAAYIERNLTSGEVARYEVHLAACPNCRIQVARLARSGYQAALTTATEVAPGFQEIAPSLDGGRANRRSEPVFSRVFAYLRQPQWIAVATAALVLLVAVPVFVVLRNAKTSQRPSANLAAQSRSGDSRPEEAKSDSQIRDQAGLHPYQGVSSFSEPIKAASSEGAATPASIPPPGAGETGTGTADGRSGGQFTPVANPAEAALQRLEEKKVEADRVSEGNQVAQSSRQQKQQYEEQNSQEKAKAVTAGVAGQVAEKLQARDQAPAPPNQVSAVQDDKEVSTRKGESAAASEQISSKDAQTLPADNNRAASILKPGGVSTDSARAKEGRQAIRPKDSEPPKPESTRDEAGERRIARGPSRESATRGRSDADSVRKSAPQQLAKSQRVEKRVENKRFRLQAGIWTDKDLKPDRDIPAVTLVRDSDVYKSVLEKQPGLRAFLAGFGPDERVIVVYKNITYRILPPKN